MSELDLGAIEARVRAVCEVEGCWTPDLLQLLGEDMPALLVHVRKLGVENAKLRRQVGELCPIAEFDTITSLRAEIQLLQEQALGGI